jgi:L-lactate dehydrogenase
MKKTTNKVVLIGAGAVGTSFLYSAINQGIAEEYGIIDVNAEGAHGNKLDLEDAGPALANPVKITHGGYEQVSDADVLVITAGRPQREGETRLEMVEDNARIMKSIADEVVANGFSGITVIASNPVDVLTTVYQEVTGFDKSKVISSSCSLDSSRLRIELSNLLGVEPKQIGAFVLGEHGDSSVSTLEHGTIMGIPFKDDLEKAAAEAGDTFEQIHERV